MNRHGKMADDQDRQPRKPHHRCGSVDIRPTACAAVVYDFEIAMQQAAFARSAGISPEILEGGRSRLMGTSGYSLSSGKQSVDVIGTITFPRVVV